MKKLLLIFGFLMILQTSNAQLFFKNLHDETLSVAVGFYLKIDGFEGWITKGWFNVEPGYTQQILDFMPSGKVYYFLNGRLSYYNGQGECYNCLLVHPNNAFQIKNADLEKPNAGRGYKWAMFAEETTEKNNWQSMTKTKHTIVYSTRGR
ncbi:MAG: DUF1036 domain-containing protein [Raineya sp.]|jgi:uncharacterized membrane protein|nr:DUF1036 domain-containing protein [Raineya sp.]